MINILSEPTGLIYTNLLKFAFSRCDSFSLVWRNHPEAEASSAAIHTLLIDALIREEQTLQWPGTQLMKGSKQALVRHYKTKESTFETLNKVASLYAWTIPALPEDLAFYEGENCWLGSIGHEQDAFFQSHSLTESEVYSHVPGIEISEVC
ncbi:hypothetical protein BH10CYA1_BH10CYA1_04960 [soil metagenome]